MKLYGRASIVTGEIVTRFLNISRIHSWTGKAEGQSPLPSFRRSKELGTPGLPPTGRSVFDRPDDPGGAP